MIRESDWPAQEPPADHLDRGALAARRDQERVRARAADPRDQLSAIAGVERRRHELDRDRATVLGLCPGGPERQHEHGHHEHEERADAHHRRQG